MQFYTFWMIQVDLDRNNIMPYKRLARFMVLAEENRSLLGEDFIVIGKDRQIWGLNK